MVSKIKIDKSKIQGRGVFSSLAIKRGEIICRLEGKEIGIKELIRIYKNKLRDSDPLRVAAIKYLDLKNLIFILIILVIQMQPLFVIMI